MNRNFLAVAVIAAIALVVVGTAVFSGLAVVLARPPAGGDVIHLHGHHAFALERLNKTLNLTCDQQAKVQPIIDQARPQLAAIHKDAIQKTHSVIDGATSQIRPLLTPDQQKKLDEVQKARQGLRLAMEQLHIAMQE